MTPFDAMYQHLNAYKGGGLLGLAQQAQQSQQAYMQAQQINHCTQIQQAAQIKQGTGGTFPPGPGKVQANIPPRYNLKETKVKDDILPDISLTRVFKWAIVLLLALGLGKKVWATFGPKIEAQLHKALELK